MLFERCLALVPRGDAVARIRSTMNGCTVG